MTGKRNAAKRLNRVIVTNRDPRQRVRKKKVAALAQRLLRELGCSKTFLSVVFVSDQRMKRLNKRHLNHPWTTDVLAFPLDTPQTGRANSSASRRVERPRFLGELFISPQRARVQAKHFNVSVSEELARYLCHGILHLLGYSDSTRACKQRMSQAEDRLLNLVSANSRMVI